MLLLAKRISLGTFHVIKSFLPWIKSKGNSFNYLLIGACLVFFSSCSAPSNVEKAVDEQILHFGLGSEPQYLDPHLANSVSAHNVIIALIEGLVSEDPKTLKPVPGVAEKWDISEDGLVYSFHLRKSAKWSNGDPVTAHDFVYSYKRILNPELASQYASMLHGLKNARKYHEQGLSWEDAKVGAIALDDHTLQLTLENPTPYFLELLNHYSWFPAHPPTIEKFGAFGKQGTAWTRPGNYVGHGPFTLSDHKVNSVIDVKKNPLYWDAQTVSLEGIRFYPIESADTEERAFHSGFLHLTQTVSPDRIDFLKENHPDLIHFESYLGTYFYRFNVEEPPFDDVRVRLAFNLATDRQAIVEKVTKGGQLPARCFTPPGTGGFSPESRFRFDPQKAKSLIQEYLTEKGLESLPKIELKYNTSEGHKKVAEALQGMWKNHLGAEIQLLNMEWKVFLSTIAKRDFSLARAGWIADYNDAQNFLYLLQSSTGSLNYGRYTNPQYDTLMSQADRTADLEARAQLMRRAERLAMDEQAVIPIYYYVSKNLVHRRIQGWLPNTKDIHRTRFISLSP